MSKIHKSKNPNRRRLSALFVMQVVFAVLPVVLLMYFIFVSSLGVPLSCLHAQYTLILAYCQEEMR